MARYVERTNGMLRLVRTSYVSSQDEIVDFDWQYILRNYSNQPESTIKELTSSNQVLAHLILDKENSNSVINNITHARENARAVQDHITKEVWQCLNEFYHLVRSENAEYQVLHGDAMSIMDDLIKQGLLYHGIVDITMARGEGSSFLSLGKYIERVNISSDTLAIKLSEVEFNVNSPLEVPALRYLLYTLSGYELFLKTHRENLKPDLVFNQILYNPNFPHSLTYGLERMSRYLNRLKADSLPEAFKSVEFLTGKLINHLKYTAVDIHDVNSLRVVLEDVRRGLFEITDAFNQHYFGNS
ncbi:MAG: alpha-E domain-containing protein [Saprospiraceae bacterium]|nr:alpha-E domain-containing protein [Saprospiraceae bacterium]